MSTSSEARLPHACAVCGRVLDHWTEDGHFDHCVVDQPTDHLPVPVLVSELGEQAIPRCDFCNADESRWELPARDFKWIEPHVSVGNWSACDTCGDLIRRNAWTALTRRCEETYGTTYGPMDDAGRLAMRRMHRALRQNVTGPLRPIDYARP